MPPVLPFQNRENKHDVYRGKGYIKVFCECLKIHANKIINFQKKKTCSFHTNRKNHMKMQKYAIFVREFWRKIW